MGGSDRVGWQAVWVNRFTPKAYWFGSRSQLLLDRRGPAAEVLKAQIVNPTKDYPYPDYYLVWLSPNGNTFAAFVARQVLDLDLELPVTAIGKEFWFFCLAGLTVVVAEVVELKNLGLSLGLDFSLHALKLPGIGHFSMGM